MKKVLSVFIVCVIILFSLPLSFAESDNVIVAANVNIAVNGQWIKPERDPLSINGRILAPARTTLSKLGITVDWYEATGKVVLKRGNDSVGMQIGRKEMNINGIVVSIDVEPMLSRGTVMVPLAHVASAFGIQASWEGATKSVILGDIKPSTPPGDNKKNYVVVVDAGHGGSDPGAVSYGVREMDLNLDIAKRLEKLLKDCGITTYMTRTDGSYVGLYERSDLANRVNADLFVSIHNNAGYMSATGTMTLYHPGEGHSKGRLTAKRFAEIVQQTLVNDLETKNHGIFARPELAVLRTTKMPAVIAEIGFMTNKTELNKLLTASYRQKAAEALKKAILSALEEI